MIQYQPCERADARTFRDYLVSLCSPIDSYLEDHICGSTFYRIVEQEAEIGSFAMEANGLLTLFHLRKAHQRLGQPVLAEIRGQFSIESALVPTCDEFFLSHALDNYRELKMQAYFFADSGIEPAVRDTAIDVQYRPARPDDIAQIQAVSGDFLDDPAESIRKQEVSVGHIGREIVAIGLIVSSRFQRRQASLGMFTAEAHRRKGIGTGTLVHLKRLCRAQAITSVSGCSYKNLASKATLEAAGMVTRTRLLRFAF